MSDFEYSGGGPSAETLEPQNAAQPEDDLPEEDAEQTEDQPGEERTVDTSRAGDSFSHVNEFVSEYTDYNRRGRYVSDGTRPLPRRYYDGTLRGDIYYEDKTLSRVEFLETAVLRGAYVLDERRSVQDNARGAEKKLIEDKARPLYTWSTTLYSEDTQIRFEQQEDGRITGYVRAFYVNADGRKMTVRYLAEQLAFGIRPQDLDGEYDFLRDIDMELCAKATMLGNAARRFRGIDAAYRAETISEKQYLDDIRLYLIYFLGRDEGHKSAGQLRDIVADSQFAVKALKGIIREAAPSAVYRRPLTRAGMDAWLQGNNRRPSPSDVDDAMKGEM